MSTRTRRPAGWLIVVLIAAVLVVVVGLPAAGRWLLSEAYGPEDGEDVARDWIRSEAARLEEDLGHISNQRNAETFAARMIERQPVPGSSPEDSLLIEPVAWSGRTFGDEVTTIDVRFTATVAVRSAAGFGERGTTAGSATMCYRYVLQLYRYTQREQIDCPDVEQPPIPVPEVVPALPPDARQRIETALLSATPESLASDVRAAFPEEFIRVDATVHGGELVAAVGIPAERECLLAVRQVDGAINYPGYDPVWLEPGELGCSVALYTAPPR